MQHVSTVALAWGHEHCPFPVLGLVARLWGRIPLGLWNWAHKELSPVSHTETLPWFPAALPALCNELLFSPCVQVPARLV